LVSFSYWNEKLQEIFTEYFFKKEQKLLYEEEHFGLKKSNSIANQDCIDRFVKICFLMQLYILLFLFQISA
jgi:myosin heavy subunit